MKEAEASYLQYRDWIIMSHQILYINVVRGGPNTAFGRSNASHYLELSNIIFFETTASETTKDN